MDNLVRWAECEIEEPRDRDARDKVAVAQGIAAVVDVLQRIACHIQVLLRSNDVHRFSILHGLANKRNVLCAENCPLHFCHFLFSTEGVKSLPVEGSLAKDRSYKTARGNMILDLFENL